MLVNPGTWTVPDATTEDAEANIATFVAELGLDGVRCLPLPESDQDTDSGRFGFSLQLGDRSCDVEMPGWPLDRVRFTQAPGQNVWHFPRLYVAGNSWLWMFAINQAKDELTPGWRK